MIHKFLESKLYRKTFIFFSSLFKKLFGNDAHSKLSFSHRYLKAKYLKILESFGVYLFSNPYYVCFGNDSNYKNIHSIINKRNGRYLEIGAVDGYFESPTYHLSSQYGWKGILVDANKKLLQYAKYYRPHDEIIFSACSNFENAKKNLTVKFLPLHHSGEIYYSDDKIDPSAKIMKDKLKIEPEEVPLSTLSNIISSSNILENNSLDLIVLDVEGHEIDVLNGINFDILKVSFILVESRTNEEFLITKKFLENKDFKLLTQTSDIDYLYQNNLL
jgi:FkbM family methyltransferase